MSQYTGGLTHHSTDVGGEGHPFAGLVLGAAAAAAAQGVPPDDAWCETERNAKRQVGHVIDVMRIKSRVRISGVPPVTLREHHGKDIPVVV